VVWVWQCRKYTNLEMPRSYEKTEVRDEWLLPLVANDGVRTLLPTLPTKDELMRGGNAPGV
jgi:hypothetical protein